MFRGPFSPPQRDVHTPSSLPWSYTPWKAACCVCLKEDVWAVRVAGVGQHSPWGSMPTMKTWPPGHEAKTALAIAPLTKDHIGHVADALLISLPSLELSGKNNWENKPSYLPSFFSPYGPTRSATSDIGK